MFPVLPVARVPPNSIHSLASLGAGHSGGGDLSGGPILWADVVLCASEYAGTASDLGLGPQLKGGLLESLAHRLNPLGRGNRIRTHAAASSVTVERLTAASKVWYLRWQGE